jgi:prevent-host-death family protein
MATRRWNVASAKARLSRLIEEARREPQVIENRGREVAVVLGIEEYRRVEGVESRSAPAERLSGFLRFSEQLRREGGARITPTRRRARRSPFSTR